MGEEIWKRSSLLPKFEVSNLGNVRRFDNKQPVKVKRGTVRYMQLCGYGIAILVITEFQGPKPFPKAECRHLDDDRYNNQNDNLAWGYKKSKPSRCYEKRQNQSKVSKNPKTNIPRNTDSSISSAFKNQMSKPSRDMFILSITWNHVRKNSEEWFGFGSGPAIQLVEAP